MQDGLQLDAEAMGLYQINITGTQSAAGNSLIFQGFIQSAAGLVV